MKTIRISDLLDAKGHDVYTVGERETVKSAAAKMTQNKIGSLIVTRGDTIAGIVTERDCLRHLASDVPEGHQTRVHEIMTRDVVVARGEQTLEECLSIMTERRCRHLPVLKGQSIAGIVSIGDLVKAAVRVQKAEIHYLHEYIAGSYPGVAAANG